MDRTQKVTKTWESYSDDDSSLEEDLELSLDGTDGSDPNRVGLPKRAMAEDKLQEKRLKERARRNGMASSIDEMRILVPELIDAKKNYSQAKVVAFALAHIYELQRENDTLRERLGMPNRMDEFRARVKANGKTKKERAPAGERGRKRRRLNEDSVVAMAVTAAPMPASASVPSTPTVAPPAPTFATNASSMPRPSTTSAAASSSAQSSVHVAVPVKMELSEAEAAMELDFVTDSLAASPALSPHALDDEVGPFGHGFESHFEQPRASGMDWEGHDDLFHPAADLFSHAAKSANSFDNFFVDHLLTNNGH